MSASFLPLSNTGALPRYQETFMPAKSKRSKKRPGRLGRQAGRGRQVSLQGLPRKRMFESNDGRRNLKNSPSTKHDDRPDKVDERRLDRAGIGAAETIRGRGEERAGRENLAANRRDP